ncbi:hypothetical protein AB0D09_44165, partial [Streptomyces sp. NPDC049097]
RGTRELSAGNDVGPSGSRRMAEGVDGIPESALRPVAGGRTPIRAAVCGTSIVYAGPGPSPGPAIVNAAGGAQPKLASSSR